jgi:hypothetical protein
MSRADVLAPAREALLTSHAFTHTHTDTQSHTHTHTHTHTESRGEAAAPACRRVLAGRVHAYLPEYAGLVAAICEAHELLRLGAREGRGQEARHAEGLANLVEAAVLVGQAPAPVHQTVWRERDHVDVTAARDEQRVDGAHDDGQVRRSRRVVRAQQAVEDEGKLAAVLRRCVPANVCVSCAYVCARGKFRVHMRAMARACLHEPHLHASDVSFSSRLSFYMCVQNLYAHLCMYSDGCTYACMYVCIYACLHVLMCDLSAFTHARKSACRHRGIYA